jgi:predicted secreted protein
MATKAITGRAGSLYWSTNLGAATSAMTKVAELQDCTFTVNRKTIDVTSHDSSGFQENLYGIQDTKLSGKVNYFSTSASARIPVMQIISNSPLNLRFSVASSTSKTTHLFVQTGLVTRFEHSLPTDKQIVGTIEMVGTGAVTRTS